MNVSIVKHISNQYTTTSSKICGIQKLTYFCANYKKASYRNPFIFVPCKAIYNLT